MSAIDTIKQKLFGGVEAGLAPLLDKLNGLSAEHARLGEERDALLTQPSIRADTGTVAALVAERHAQLVALHGADLRAALTGGLTWGMESTVGRMRAQLPDLSAFSAFDLLVLLDPERAAARLVACVPAGGPGALTIPARLARIAEIDQERDRIAAEHAQLVDRAASLTPPLVLDHLPVTVGRRQADANAREQAERQAAEQHAEAAAHAKRYGA